MKNILLQYLGPNFVRRLRRENLGSRHILCQRQEKVSSHHILQQNLRIFPENDFQYTNLGFLSNMRNRKLQHLIIQRT